MGGYLGRSPGCWGPRLSLRQRALACEDGKEAGAGSGRSEGDTVWGSLQVRCLGRGCEGLRRQARSGLWSSVSLAEHH